MLLLLCDAGDTNFPARKEQQSHVRNNSFDTSELTRIVFDNDHTLHWSNSDFWESETDFWKRRFLEPFHIKLSEPLWLRKRQTYFLVFMKLWIKIVIIFSILSFSIKLLFFSFWVTHFILSGPLIYWLLHGFLRFMVFFQWRDAHIQKFLNSCSSIRSGFSTSVCDRCQVIHLFLSRVVLPLLWRKEADHCRKVGQQ